MSRVVVITTGGTIATSTGADGVARPTQTGDDLTAGLRTDVDVEVVDLMAVDSSQLTPSDWDRMSAAVTSAAQAGADGVVITHGTDTMVDTARALAAATLDKTIVLTGAMVPYAFGSSDGLFNLGSALSFAQVLPAGVYIAMNGRHFTWNNVRKNREAGVFEAAEET